MANVSKAVRIGNLLRSLRATRERVDGLDRNPDIADEHVARMALGAASSALCAAIWGLEQYHDALRRVSIP